MIPIQSCSNCDGAHGWYVMPNGDHYLSDEPGSVWTACEHCGGTGVEPDETESGDEE